MATKLENITTQYRRFTKNQVLTESHLNEVLDYFDDQVRLSRICLDGVGIVCGFKLNCPNSSTLEVTQGAGVTTDGDLFHLFKINEETGSKVIDVKKLAYTHYQVYDNEKSPYKPFFYQANKQIELYELFTGAQNQETHQLSQLGTNEGLNLKDLVALLYLESYEKEQDLCVSLTCDNQGVQLVGNYKLLLTSKIHAANIISLDEIISQTNFEHLFYKLPDVLSNRSIVLKEDFDNYPKLKNKFVDEALKNNLLQRVRKGYNTLLDGMGLNQIKEEINSRLDDLFVFKPSEVLFDFQYRYDLLKDLIDTYNEIKAALAYAEASQCCAPNKAFPKHLMLGEVQRTDSCFEFRHGFYKSAAAAKTDSNCGVCDPKKGKSSNAATEPEFVVDFKKAKLAVCYTDQNGSHRIKSLIQRAVLMLTNYNPNYNFVKTTPSRHLGPLSNKAIPFYYNVGNQLIGSWDYNKTNKGNHLKNISYHNSFLDIKKPLNFCIDTDFYRIEGHQGKNYLEVLEILKEIKLKNALAFNVIALPINATDRLQVIENYTSYYLSKNVGLEHKAGVVPGGTFVMIYIAEENDPYPYDYGYYNGYSYDDNIPFASDFEPSKYNDIKKTKKPKEDKSKPILTGDNQPPRSHITGKDKPILKDDRLTPKLGAEVFTPMSIEGRQKILNPIVADFMLPYLCCDENVVELSLPVDFLCFSSDTKRIPFDVSPTGGFVEAIVDDDLNGGVFKTNSNSFVFDPSQVSEELYGIPIFFKVNNIETETSITVLPQVIFNIETVDINYDYPNNNATVTFQITGDNIPAGQQFDWEFGDGSGVISSSNLNITHSYDLEILGLLDEPRVEARTRAENGDCNTESTMEVVFEIQPEIFLDASAYCRSDDNRHPFTVVPKGANIVVAGEGVVLDNTEYFFVPASVPAGTNSVTFTVNGIPSNLTVTIEDRPVANFTHRFAGDTLFIDNTSDLAVDYEWNINGEKIIRVNRTSINLTISKLPNTIQVSLSANSANCAAGIVGPRTIVIREGSTCEENASKYMNDAILKFEDIQKDNRFQNLPGETSFLYQSIFDRFLAVEKDQPIFFKGDRNQDLPEIFGDVLYTELLERYLNAESTFEIMVMQFLTESVTRLSYTILACQDDKILVEFTDSIQRILSRLTNYLNDLLKNKIDPDPKDDIINYLQSTKDRFASLQFILDQTVEQIETLK